MSLYESIHEFVGDRETLQSVSQHEGTTVLLTDTRLVEVRYTAGGASQDDLMGLRSIQLNRLLFAGYSVEFDDDRTVIEFHGEAGETVESVTLPARDHSFVAAFSAVVGDAEAVGLASQ
ncbi:hypothetical protein C440_04738 [Haloferax mucosum ATCC BAA-1512]|uniref:Uncharacterized protein n=1 Tax=Haloferax mucosum ATCC BAA-1512 TaxID=662479 RepID=M0IJZ9_9EURY|nr:hypothetical protein [Haloferax mucosum]ELZ97055.1 hypothetical protein C440_04738 [Haloferax mucosum ATCC BAA-1512]